MIRARDILLVSIIIMHCLCCSCRVVYLFFFFIVFLLLFFFFQAEDGIRDLVRSRGLGDVYKRQIVPVIISASTLGLFAYVAGHSGIASYLQITHVQGASELAPVAATILSLIHI